MVDISIEVVREQLLGVLREAFEGPAQWSYFADPGPEGGLFGTLARLSAIEASRPIGKTSIAAHVHHVVFSLESSSAWMHGDRSSRDWSESWRISAVDDAAWSRLRDQLRAGYENLLQAFEEQAASSVEALGGTLGAIAHVAYHLGAIRQKIGFGAQD